MSRSALMVPLGAFAVLVAILPARVVAHSQDASVQRATGLDVTVGEPFTIVKSHEHLTWGFWTFPELRKCGDGSLLLSFSTGEDAWMAVQRAPALYRSTDGGKTWRPDEMGELRPLSPRVRDSMVRYNGRAPQVGMGALSGLSAFCALSDGTCISHFYHAVRGEAPELFLDSMWRSSDGGRAWVGPADVELTVPGNKLDELGRGPAIWRRAVELGNGDLVTTAHTLFEDDEKLRVISLGSSDKGRSWSYLGTVAHDPNIDTEGFTEPIVCRCNAATDVLICFMRTQGHHPMYQAWSRDGGKIWTEPRRSGVTGVAPDMHLLSDGVLACSYGRPGVNIMFSADGTGREWTNHTSIFEGGSTCYTCFEEVEPGRLLLVFDAINFRDVPDAELANCIRGVYIEVRRVETR